MVSYSRKLRHTLSSHTTEASRWPAGCADSHRRLQLFSLKLGRLAVDYHAFLGPARMVSLGPPEVASRRAIPGAWEWRSLSARSSCSRHVPFQETGAVSATQQEVLLHEGRFSFYNQIHVSTQGKAFSVPSVAKSLSYYGKTNYVPRGTREALPNPTDMVMFLSTLLHCCRSGQLCPVAAGPWPGSSVPF